MNFISIIIQILTINILIFCGYILRKKEIITDVGTSEISRFISLFIFPVFLFKGFLVEFDPANTINLFVMMILAFVYLIISIIASTFTSKKMASNLTDKNTLIYTNVFGNLAFLGFPIIETIYPTYGVLFGSMFCFVQNLVQWTYGINLLKNKKLSEIKFKNLFSPTLIAIFLGITFYFLRIKLPTIIDTPLTYIKNLTIPLALIVTGSTLYGKNIKEIFLDRKIQLTAIFKTFVLPLIFLLVIKWLPINLLIGANSAIMIKTILMIQAAGPTQSSSTAIMKTYGGNPEITAKAIFLSTLYCALSIPLYLFIIQL